MCKFASMKYFGVIISVLLALSSCSHKGEVMRERLDYVSQCNRADTVFTEAWLPTVDSLVRFFDRHGNANERMMAHYLQGRVHHDMGEAPIALECYQKATEMADTTRKDCDLHTLAAIYGQMADLFHLQYLPDDEMNAIKMAEHYDWKNKDTLSAIIAYVLRTRPLYMRNEMDSVMEIEKEARELYLKHGYPERAGEVIISTINILIERGEYDEAKKYMQIYERESGRFDPNGNLINGSTYYYYEKGRYYLAYDKIDSALTCFYNLRDKYYDESRYKGLMSAYEKKRIPDSIAKYARLYANANDSSYLHVNQNMVHKISAMHDYSRHRQVAEEQTVRLERTKRHVVAMIGAFIAFILLIIILYVNRKRKLEEKVNSVTRDYAKLHIELLRHKAEAADIEGHYSALLDEKTQKERELLERIQSYKDEISTRNSEYTSIMDELHNTQSDIETIRESYENTMVGKNAIIEALQTRVDDLTKAIQEVSCVDSQKEFFDSEIYHVFDTRRKFRIGYQPPTDAQWDEFLSLFKVYFTQYYIFISKKNMLSQDQLRLCVLIRLNFTESEMALLMGRNHKQAINKVKAQTNRKLFGKNEARSLKDNLLPHF